MTVYVTLRDGQELLGVFSTPEEAAAACTRLEDGYGPAVLDERLPDEQTVWPGFVYPRDESPAQGDLFT
jgi:hypothetical protein